LTASLVLDLAGVTPSERLTINADASLDALLAGDIDAFCYVAGAPTSIFTQESIDPERFHLVPIADPVLQAVYQPATISDGTYPFQSGPVDVVAVKAVLMTYEYDPGRNPYHRESCQAVTDISHLVLTRFGELLETGHPKWQQVDLNDIPPGWEVGNCVNRGLQATHRLACDDGGPVVDTTGDSEANSAYRQRICAVIGC
jgi:hypothetical protein